MAVPRLRLALVVTAALGSTLAAEVDPPVPLRTPALLVPEETAGSGLAPEASIRISIDERGMVTRVEVLSITPSTEHDELFRARLTETLTRWRYAPQVRDGVAEPTTLAWRVAFPSRPGTPAVGTATEAVAPAALQGSDAETRRSAILALPERQRLALLGAQLAIARGRLDPARTRKAEGDHAVVHCDAEDERAGAILAQNFDAIFRALAQQLLPGIDLLPEKYKLQVVAYRHRASYLSLMNEMPVYEWSSGFYSPAGMVALHLEQDSNAAVLSLLLHEATHAFLDRHIVRRGVALPRWMGEGFADYVGNSDVKKGRLVPGKTLRGKLELSHGTLARYLTAGALQLDAAKKALRKGKGLGVGELLGASAETFYGEQRDLYYASAWLLVHYLRDGGADFAAERFPRAMLYLAEGYPPDAVLRQLYGPVETVDAAFRDYVRSF